jgi:hypothetical protein
MKIMTEAERAYVAGLLDGEGCISMFLAKQVQANGTVGQRIGVSLSMYMTHKETVEYIKFATGTTGNILPIPGRENRRDQWLWKPNLKEAYAVLQQCEPYMITKKENVRLFIKIMDIRKQSTRTDRRWDEQVAIMEANQILNKRGRD